MKYNNTHIIAPKECPYTLEGTNLAGMRRAILNKIANNPKIGVPVAETKNGTLGAIIGRLKALGAPSELKPYLSE